MSVVCSLVIPRLYARIKHRGFRSSLRRVVLKLEHSPVYSLTIRQIFRRYHQVNVGLYTIGPCGGDPESLRPGTDIGRYSSIYYTVRALSFDGMRSSDSPSDFLFDAASAEAKTAASGNLYIGNDVFIGHNAIILPTVERIGDGSIVGAGSVVKKDVPPYALAMGNPARVVRYRFSEEKIAELLESQWWLKSIDELSGEMDEFQKPLEGDVIR